MKTSSNKSRTLINLVGFPLILFIIYQGGILFTLFFVTVSILAIHELNKLTMTKDYSINSFFLYISSILIYFSDSLKDFNKVLEINFFYILIVLFICIWEIFRFKRKPLANVSLTILGLVWIIIFLNKAIFIRDIESGGYELILCMFLSVWSCDSAAFYFGSKLGRKKILSKISPNKTWVGSIAGYVASLLIVYLFVYFDVFNKINYTFDILDVIVLGTIFGVVGQLGDFFESMFKREIDVKDSGTILQGHGGILDRFDSLLFVIPSLYIYIQYFIIN